MHSQSGSSPQYKKISLAYIYPEAAQLPDYPCSVSVLADYYKDLLFVILENEERESKVAPPTVERRINEKIKSYTSFTGERSTRRNLIVLSGDSLEYAAKHRSALEAHYHALSASKKKDVGKIFDQIRDSSGYFAEVYAANLVRSFPGGQVWRPICEALNQVFSKRQ